MKKIGKNWKKLKKNRRELKKIRENWRKFKNIEIKLKEIEKKIGEKLENPKNGVEIKLPVQCDSNHAQHTHCHI